MTTKEPFPISTFKQDPDSGLFIPAESMSKAVEVVDSQDELEVMFREKTGQEIDAWLYEFQLDGRWVRGLGIQGVTACFEWVFKELGTLDFRECLAHHDPGQEGRIFTAAVVVTTPDGKKSRAGLASALEYPLKRDRSGRYFNLFAAPTALSKAERNAMRKLIPTKKRLTFEAAVLAAKHGAGRVKTLESQATRKRKKTENVQEWDGASRALHAEAHKLGIPVDALHKYICRKEATALRRPMTSLRQVPVKHLAEWSKSLRAWDERTMLLVYKGCGVKPAEALRKFRAARGKK